MDATRLGLGHAGRMTVEQVLDGQGTVISPQLVDRTKLDSAVNGGRVSEVEWGGDEAGGSRRDRHARSGR